MSMARFLFIGIPDDPHLHDVGDALKRKGCEVTLANSRAFDAEDFAPKTLSQSTPSWDAIWVRYLPPLFPSAKLYFKAQEIQKQRALRSFLLQWLQEQKINSVPVLPQLTDGTYDQYKNNDLNFAKQAGITIPQTRCTLNMESALKFIRVQSNDLIVKPLIGGAYATILDPKSLEDYFRKWGPLILQERIFGQNCRVLYFEKQPLKTFIAPPLEEVDWRERDSLSWQPFELPQDFKTKLLHFFELSKHKMSSVDLIVNPDNIYFLEANTTPSWLDLPKEHATEQTHLVAQFFGDITNC